MNRKLVTGKGPHDWATRLLLNLSLRDISPIAVCFLLILVIYQFASARLLDLRSFQWLSREREPLIYWTVLGAEAAIAAFAGLRLFLLPLH